MYDFTSEGIDLERIRKGITVMPDDILEQYGKAAASMVERSNLETFRVQRDEAHAEWRRRHPASG